jgi:hypothetical protein
MGHLLTLVSDRFGAANNFTVVRPDSGPIPCDHIPVRSWPLFKARQLMRDVIELLQGELKKY